MSFGIRAQTASSLTQTASVEKSINEIQTGFLGLLVHNESRLSNSIALRTEPGPVDPIVVDDGFSHTFDFDLPKLKNFDEIKMNYTGLTRRGDEWRGSKIELED